MSKQRVVKDEIWDDEWFYDLDPSEKLIWLFLLTNPRSNIAGVYKINTRWVANLTGFDKDVVKTILSRFVEDGKIVYEDDWVALVNFHKHLVYKNPSVSLGIKRLGDEMTGCPQAVYSVYLTLLNLTQLNLSDREDKSSNKKEKDMAGFGYTDEPDLPTIGDDGEIEKTEEARTKEQNEKVTALIKWAEKVRKKKFIDLTTQRKMIHDMRKAKISPDVIKDTFKELLHSEYWTTGDGKDRLPDFKTVFSSLKNKK